jgi:hypothetical protein
MFGIKTKIEEQYDSLLIAYNQLRSQNVNLFEENERRRQWNIKQDEEVHNLRMTVYRLQEIMKELELDKKIDSEVKTLIVKKKRGRPKKEKVMEEKKMGKGSFSKDYWAWRKADPEKNKLSMKEYASQVYQKTEKPKPIDNPTQE